MLERRIAFIRAFLKDPVRVAAVAEATSGTVRAGLDSVDLGRASCVLELGTGTGPWTEQILQRIGIDCRFLAFEISEPLAADLARRLPDPRLRVINDLAEHLPQHVNPREVDLVVSGLPFSSMREPARDAMLSEIVSVMKPEGVMLAVQYTAFRRRDLERFFGAVTKTRPHRQVTPLLLFRCSQPRLAEAAYEPAAARESSPA
jgi:phospholipid N-methyltransferase